MTFLRGPLQVEVSIKNSTLSEGRAFSRIPGLYLNNGKAMLTISEICL